MLGGKELEEGEEREVSDNTSQSILNYIGAANESDNTPDYTNATGSAITNIHLIDSENLTKGMKRLEHRDDVIPRVRVVDIISSSLPTGASVTIDGQVLNNGDYVFFTNSAIEGLYKVSGVGSSVAFEPINAFKGITSPVDGDLIRVENGTNYFRTVWKRVANEWKPLEVKEATKEPTGFPNRVDSELSFDNGTRTFTIEPKAPQTYFDIFVKGKPYRFTTPQSIVIPDTEGIFFFYFETDGTLQYDTVFDITLITERVFTATVYWDAINQDAILIGDERHGITMDAATHSYLHNLNGSVLTEGGDIGFTEYTGAVGAPAQFDGQVAGMTTDVTIDADNNGIAGNVTLAPDFGAQATAQWSILNTPIVFTNVQYTSSRNGEPMRLEVATALPLVGDSVRVEFIGDVTDLKILVTPNDGTNNSGTPVTLTTAEIVEVVNTGAVVGKNIELIDIGGDRTLQTATGGDSQIFIGITSSVFINGADPKDVNQLILDHNTTNPTNTLTLSAGDGSQIPTANITLTGGINGSGDLNSDAQISLNNMTLRDEDIVMDITNAVTLYDGLKFTLDDGDNDGGAVPPSFFTPLFFVSSSSTGYTAPFTILTSSDVNFEFTIKDYKFVTYDLYLTVQISNDFVTTVFKTEQISSNGTVNFNFTPAEMAALTDDFSVIVQIHTNGIITPGAVPDTEFVIDNWRIEQNGSDWLNEGFASIPSYIQFSSTPMFSLYSGPDEDADIFQQILDPIAELPIYYKNGIDGDWRRNDATQFPVKQGASRIQYNNPAGPWTQEDIQEGYYTSMWIFATNNQDEPVIAILGQAEHDSLTTAQELDTPQSINLAGMPTVEFKLLYRIIFQSSTAFVNTPKAIVRDVRDLRAVEDTAFAQVAPNDHGSLSGLTDPDHPANAINTSDVEKDGGLSEFDVGVGDALTTLNRLLGQLRIKPHPTNGNRVVITGANRILNSGTTLIQEIKNLVIDFEGAEIDFVTGQIFKADGLTSLGIDFTPEVIPANEYLNYSITLIPAEVNADNTISAQLIVLPASGSNAVKANAPKAPFAQGTKLGQVTVQESGGGIATLDESSISQLGTGGGGSGGTGDANELLERLKNRLNVYGTYEYMTPVIFSSVEEDLSDELNTTAEYSVVNSNYDFPLVGSVLTSVQMLDDEFLAEEIELTKIELVHYWNLEAIDELATYEVSRDGGNEWQSVTMDRIGQSDTYLGSHIFAEEATNNYTQTVGGAIVPPVIDLTDLVEPSRIFTLPFAITNKIVTAEITKTGAATGYVYAVAVKDDGFGSPSTDPNDKIGQSSFVSIDGLSAGSQDVDFNVRFTAPAEDYHIIFKTDSIYKTDYTNGAGANKISISGDGSGIVYTLKGSELDLRVRITSGTAEVVSEGFGIFYKEDTKISPVDGLILRNTSTFVGDVDNLNEFALTFEPDVRLMTVYEIGTGQAYRYGAWVINAAGNVEFPPNTFNKPETITLEFLQIHGSSFDNSDRNGLLLASNFLGSLDPTLDLSIPGRGILLRSYDGTLYEIVIKDGGVGFDIYLITP
jgi:hypothetical protein